MASSAFQQFDLRALLDAISSHPLTIPSCGAFRVHAKMVHRMHAEPAAKVLMVMEGQMTYCIHGTSVKLERGAMLYRPAMSSASWTAGGRTPLQLSYCEFISDRFKFPAEAMWTKAADPELEGETLQRIRHAFLDPDQLSIYKGVAELKVLLMRFFQQAATMRAIRKTRRGRSGAAGERAVQAALAILSEHFAEAAILTGLHEQIRMSEDHFRRVFRRITGLSPQQYLLRVRMTAAKAYLEKSNLSVKEVSRSIGYADPLYFSRLYRQHFDHAPTDARRRD
jgi:AraC-like DNA-binding protein